MWLYLLRLRTLVLPSTYLDADAAPKFTPEVIQCILDALRTGNNRTTAAKYAGICYRTLYYWIRAGKNPAADARFKEFRAQVKKAEAEAVVRNVALIQAAASTQWTAAAWWLERSHPLQWASDKKLIQELKRRLEKLEKAEHVRPDHTANAPPGTS